MPDEVVLTVQSPFASDSWTETTLSRNNNRSQHKHRPQSQRHKQKHQHNRSGLQPPVSKKNEEEPAIDVSEYIKSIRVR